MRDGMKVFHPAVVEIGITTITTTTVVVVVVAATKIIIIQQQNSTNRSYRRNFLTWMPFSYATRRSPPSEDCLSTLARRRLANVDALRGLYPKIIRTITTATATTTIRLPMVMLTTRNNKNRVRKQKDAIRPSWQPTPPSKWVKCRCTITTRLYRSTDVIPDIRWRTSMPSSARTAFALSNTPKRFICPPMTTTMTGRMMPRTPRTQTTTRINPPKQYCTIPKRRISYWPSPPTFRVTLWGDATGY
mmetsp:Transcript_13246/g.28628  ORF Transcript_13246/g.28628 Transcript_13246/m.28628 type:complete len:246 (+) Transcript_13246:53-790(+)